MSLETTPATRNPLAPITLNDVLALKTSLQPEASEAASVPVLLTTDELVDAEYENYLDDRFGRYGY